MYNVQHDCHAAKCTASGVRPLMQERTESGIVETVIKHQQINRFVINTHAFHNAHLLRATLPRSLVAPSPLFLDRKAQHAVMAGRLRANQEIKRASAKPRVKKKVITTQSVEASSSGSTKRKRTDPSYGEDEMRLGMSGINTYAEFFDSI
jgi:hypothetical protein